MKSSVLSTRASSWLLRLWGDEAYRLSRRDSTLDCVSGQREEEEKRRETTG